MCVTILGESDLVISVLPGAVEDNLPLREFYRQEMNWQIVHDSLHAREGHWHLVVPDAALAAGDESGAAHDHPMLAAAMVKLQ